MASIQEVSQGAALGHETEVPSHEPCRRSGQRIHSDARVIVRIHHRPQAVSLSKLHDIPGVYGA